ncbi:HECT-domain-containing protein [Pleurostoma richardsiae]|uniref:HECT-type E3 ubiquitin transferase n=1 Tax=Pleurostoma richardsiae TaxID=41990 RepID=A0AA38RMT3_9PEZI|nr:HECT-domain-containing protein [Pleurostoma richardsiae]
MFPTFTGSSRRPRNVNLSGQKNVNPFAATSWTPSTSSNASKTVADAQAERRQRHQERERLKAAQSIQKTWRGHRTRRSLKEARRHSFDNLYDDTTISQGRERCRQALPLILYFFDARRLDDSRRLELFAQDLIATKCSLLGSNEVHDFQLRRLARGFLEALRMYISVRKDAAGQDSAVTEAATFAKGSYDELPTIFLVPLLEIFTRRPRAARDSLGAYYDIVAEYSRWSRKWDKASLDLLRNAIIAPLSAESLPEAYSAFAFSFLAQSHLSLFEEDPAFFAGYVRMDSLSKVILEAFSDSAISSRSKDDLLWLLAHFIALEKARRGEVGNPLYLSALYTQLSNLAEELRNRPIRHASTPETGGDVADTSLPPYVAGALESLVDKNEMTDILDQFTANYSNSSSKDFAEASLLAAYILTLIRCFPHLSDEIRMRLYGADIASPTGRAPSVKFFWTAMSRTTAFSRIVSDDKATLSLLQRRDSRTATLWGNESLWDREWRTVLLFLELYTFVLRLADDDDFFGALSPPLVQSSSASRLRQCGLLLQDLKALTLFLRNLAFTLYYNANDILQDDSVADRSTTTIDDLFSGRAASTEIDKTGGQRSQSFSIVSGFDFRTFRNMVSTAMTMLYERDSRRQFLPSDHWLMTSRFDMESFLSAVVLEQQRQQELAEAGSDAEDEKEDEDMEDYDQRFLSYEGVRRSQYAKMEKFRARQKRALRDRMLAAIGPKLEILRNMPFVIPFDTRVKIFRQFVYLDKYKRRDGNIDPDNWRMAVLNQHGGFFNPNTRGREVIGRHHAKIRRGKIFQDAFEQFYELGEGLKEPIQITFVDQFDTPEAGIDGGGVTKEFLTSITKEAFTDELTLFTANNNNSLYPNPCAVDQRVDKLRQAGLTEGSEEWRESVTELLEQYEFLGRILGKCLYEGILIDIVFAGFFLLKWSVAATDAGYRANINDLKELDEELYQGMLSLKNYPGDVAELGLDFTIEDQVSLPGEPVRTITRNLIPNGDQVPVTNENRPLYISYVARHRLVAQPYAQTRAFLRGLGGIIDPSWLSMFNQSELQRLVGGDSSEIDVEDLRRNTEYSGLYVIGDDGVEHPTVQLFWEVMHSLKDSQRRDVLKYVTSTPRAPLLGFSQLSPKFSIRDGGDDQERLPSASTCVNLLKLPLYRSATVLKKKLLYAVSSNAGFDLS